MFKTNSKAVQNDLLELFKKLQADQLARTAALTSRALILDRVQQRGRNSAEQRFKPYSTRPFAISYVAFLNSKQYAFNKKAIAAVNRLLKKPRLLPHSLSSDEVEIFTTKEGVRYIVFGGGYKQFRELAGRQTNHVDMTFTSQMLSDFSVLPNGSNSWGLGFNNLFSLKKYQSNVKKRGEFLILSTNEIVQMRNVIQSEVSRIINNV